MRLAWQNKADDATLTAGSEIATLPATNVQQAHLSRKWHTAAGVKSSYLRGDMGSQLACSLFALLGTNISENGSMRLRLSPTSADMTSDVVFDTGTVHAARRKVLSLPGTSGNYASTPDSPANSITGDIDIRMKVALNDWTPAGYRTLITKAGSVGQFSYLLTVNPTTGTLGAYLSSDGVTAPAKNSTVAVGASNGAPTWVRVTLDGDNGAGGHDVKFYTSADGVAWTQLGATVTTAGTLALFDSSDAIRLGERMSGEPASGKIYYAEIRRGIDGTVVARFDPDTDADVGDTSFTSSETREVWTINQSGTPKAEIVVAENAGLKDGYGALYKDIELAYLKLPGIAGNYASTPDSAAGSVTGDLDVRVNVALADWTPSSIQGVLGKNVADFSQFSYALQIEATSGLLTLYWTEDGTTSKGANSTAVVSAADGAAKWLRATLDVDNGTAGRDVKFYTSGDYNPKTGEGTWSQLGATVTQAGTTSVFDGNGPLQVGARANGSLFPCTGKIYYAEIRNGIDGQVVAAFDPSRAAASEATTLTAKTGEVWTINQSGSPAAEIIKDESVTFRYWQLDLADNSLADNLQVGRLFLGPDWEPSVNQLYDWSVTALDESQVGESYGKQSFPDERPQKRVLDFVLDFMDEAEMYGNAFALARSAGVVREVLAVPDIDGAYVSEQAVYGLVTASQPLMHRAARIYRQKFSIKERL